jgi:hypothetical protein
MQHEPAHADRARLVWPVEKTERCGTVGRTHRDWHARERPDGIGRHQLLSTACSPWTGTVCCRPGGRCPAGNGALGRLAQMARAAGLQPAGRGFESLSAHWCDVGERGPEHETAQKRRAQAQGPGRPAPPGNGGAPRRGAGRGRPANSIVDRPVGIRRSRQGSGYARP